RVLPTFVRPMVRAYILNRLRELRAVIVRHAQTVPEGDPSRTWLKKAVRSTEDFISTIPASSPISTARGWLTVGVSLATTLGITKFISKQADEHNWKVDRFVAVYISLIALEFVCLFGLTALLAFSTKRTILLGNAALEEHRKLKLPRR